MVVNLQMNLRNWGVSGGVGFGGTGPAAILGVGLHPPPRESKKPGGGMGPPPRDFDVLIRAPPPGSKTRPPLILILISGTWPRAEINFFSDNFLNLSQ